MTEEQIRERVRELDVIVSAAIVEQQSLYKLLENGFLTDGERAAYVARVEELKVEREGKVIERAAVLGVSLVVEAHARLEEERMLAAEAEELRQAQLAEEEGERVDEVDPVDSVDPVDGGEKDGSDGADKADGSVEGGEKISR